MTLRNLPTMTSRAAVLALLTLAAACDLGDALRSLRPPPPTAYERYAQSLSEAGLAATALGREWLAA
ncbi:MAG: hypothetical protein ACT4R6_11810, partial [Gemmatimonadaceae bacterium]